MDQHTSLADGTRYRGFGGDDCSPSAAPIGIMPSWNELVLIAAGLIGLDIAAYLIVKLMAS